MSKSIRTVLKIFGISSIICILLFASLPKILSTSIGKELLLKALSYKIDGQLSIKKIKIQWFKGQLVEGLTLKDSLGNQIVSFEIFTTSQSLWDILRNGCRLTKASLIDLNAVIIPYRNGMTNLEVALSAKRLSKEELIALTDVSALIATNVTSFIEISDNEKLAMGHIEGKTQQGDVKGEFNFNADFYFEPQTNLTHPENVKLFLEANDFPIEFADIAISIWRPCYHGILPLLFGDFLNVSMHEKQTNSKNFTFCTITSPNIKLNFEGTFDKTHIEINVDSEFKNRYPFLKELLGEQIQFNLQGECHEGAGQVSFALSSDNIQLSKTTLLISQELKLEKPIKLNYVLSPKIFNRLCQSSITLRDPAHFQFIMEEFSYSNPLKNDKETPLKIDAKLIAMSKIQFDNPVNGALSLENAGISLKGFSSDSIQLALTSGITTEESSSNFRKIFGPSTQVNLFADFLLTSSKRLEVSDAKLVVDGSTIQSEVNGQFHDGHLELSTPATMRYAMNPSLLQIFFPSFTGIRHIEQDIPILLTIASQKIPFCGFSNLELSGHFSIPSIPFRFDDQQIILCDIMMPWEFDGFNKKGKLNLSGCSYLSSNGEKGIFKGRYIFKDWGCRSIFKTASHKLKLDLINFPARAFDIIYKEDVFTTLMGNSLQAEIDTEFNLNSRESTCDFFVEGDEFLLKTAFTIGRHISLKNILNPMNIRMKLTPHRFELLSKILRPHSNSSLELTSDSNFEISLNYLDIPLARRKNSIPFWNVGIKGMLHLDKMMLRDENIERKLDFNEITVNVDTDNLASSLAFDLSTIPDTSGEIKGELSIKGTIENAFKKNGELNFEDISLKGNIAAKEFQTDAFCQLFCPYPKMSDKLQALIGDPISTLFDVKIQKMEGPIKGTLKGSNGYGSLNACIKNGYLILNEPFIAQVKATPELGKSILREIAPFLSGLKHSTQLLTLRVESEGFTFPIKEFDRNKISVGLCSLDMGKLFFKNSGQMQAILGLLGTRGADTIPIWVTPLYIKMKEGKIKLERVDMLLNNLFPIATWGTVDIAKEKVNMVMGISGYALAKALNIQNIQSDYMLQIPLKGPLNNPKLDKKRAAGKISSLLAQEQGTQGMVIGTVLEIATGGLTESPPPSPTIDPLPWLNELPQREITKSAKEPNDKNQKKMTQEKVKNSAQKLLNKVFK